MGQRWRVSHRFAAIVTFLCWLYDRRIRNIREQLDDETDLEKIRLEFSPENDPFIRYVKSTNKFIQWTNAFFGKPFGIKSFLINFCVSLVYPIFLFIFSWACGASGAIDGIMFMPNISISSRIFYTTFLFGFLIAIYMLSKHEPISNPINERIVTFINYFIKNKINKLGPFDSFYLHKILYTDVIFIIFSFFLSLSLSYFGIIAGSIILLFTALVSVMSKIRSLPPNHDSHVTFYYIYTGRTHGYYDETKMRIFAIFITLVFSFVLLAFSATAESNSQLVNKSIGRQVLIFLMLLPLANAVADWISWGLSRRILISVCGEARGLAIVKRVALSTIINFFVALACLVLIVVVTACMFEAFDNYLSGAHFSWRSEVLLAIEAPFPNGILLCGILLTTMIPTFIQLWYGCLGIVSAPSTSNEVLLQKINEGISTSQKQYVSKQLFWRDILNGGAALLMSAVLFTMFVVIISKISGYAGITLSNIALASARIFDQLF
ncbi:hypothetical protein [Asticcacaulis taihuensis]|uniref:hypothetical protein n=1 Tax=Asticcacaulis taihuensis TaxID=260084 RepID=UPI003F7C2E89